MSRVVAGLDRVLWLIAAWKVWRPRLYLASRALLGVPGEVVLRGQCTIGGLEVRGPVTCRFAGDVEATSVEIRS